MIINEDGSVTYNLDEWAEFEALADEIERLGGQTMLRDAMTPGEWPSPTPVTDAEGILIGFRTRLSSFQTVVESARTTLASLRSSRNSKRLIIGAVGATAIFAVWWSLRGK